MSEHFSAEHKEILKSVFTELSDLIHRAGIKRIIGAGHSALPFAIALSRAHKKRHGTELHVINLGKLGEISKYGLMPDKLKERLSRHGLGTNSLLFDDVMVTGNSMTMLSLVLRDLSVPHARAVVGAVTSVTKELVDYCGVQNLKEPFFRRLVLSRGSALENVRRIRREGTSGHYDIQYLAQVRRELREVADSVERAN